MEIWSPIMHNKKAGHGQGSSVEAISDGGVCIEFSCDKYCVVGGDI